MKLLIALFLIISPGLLNAQDQPIDKMGWELPEISVPNSFTPLDSGTVNYLLKLDKSGKVKSIKVLSSTFNKEAELKFRNEIKEMTFVKTEMEKDKVGYRGTFQISLNACITSKKPLQS